MLTAIEQVDQFRSMSTWSGTDESGELVRLGRWSIVYGSNGSGKSTLAELLRLTSRGDAPCKTRLGFWDGSSTTSIVVDAHAEELPYQLHVFNGEYVRANLSEFLDGTGQCLGLVRLGEASIASAAEENSLTESIDALETRSERVRSVCAAENRSISEAVDSAKGAVISALEAYLPVEYNSQRYNIAKVRSSFDAADYASLSESGRLTAKATLGTTSLPSLTMPIYPPIDFHLLAQRVAELSSRSITSTALDSLKNDRALERWVGEGVRLHEVGDDCKFCGGVVSAVRISMFEQHFDVSLRDLLAELSLVGDDVDHAVDALNRWLGEVPSTDLVDSRLRPEYTTSLQEAHDSIRELVGMLEELSREVTKRKSNPFEVAGYLAPAFPAVKGVDELKRLVDLHQLARTNLQAERSAAGDALRRDALAAYGPVYLAHRDRPSIGQKAISVIDRRVSELRRRLREMQARRHDTSSLAEAISSDLNSYTGNDLLTVSVSRDGDGYQVLRDGNPASNLSEGEKNSIALLYFLRSLEESSVDAASSIVVVDDPMSSLDKEATFAAYSLLKHRLQKYRQAIVLTHDFEFFRIWRTGLASQYKRELEEPSPAAPKVKFLEMRSKIIASSAARTKRPVLAAVSASLLKHTTEYHYLFERVGRAVVARDDAELPLLPNAARRLLEGFLSFRAPSATSMRSRFDAASGGGRVDPTLSDRVYRFSNGLSHREDPNPRSALDFPSVGVELQMTMRFMHAADRAHFEAMARACSLDVDALTSGY